MENRVKGNYISFCVPVKQKTITSAGTSETTYIPAEGDKIAVRLVGYNVYRYEPTINESGYLVFEDNGKLDLGSYGLEVLIEQADGKSLRSYEPNMLCIVNSNGEASTTSANSAVAIDATLYAYTSTTTGAVDGMSEAQVRALLASYATIASLSAYAKKTDIPSAYDDTEIKVELAQKANTSDIPQNYLTSSDLQGYAQESALNGKVDKINGKGLSANDYTDVEKAKVANALTEHQSLTDYLKKSDASATYQPKGNYITEHQSLDGYLTSAVAAQTYQPKGSYLEQHQDISGKADKEEIVTLTNGTATLQPNKMYKFGTTETLDVSLALPTETTHVNHYHFSFTATDSTSLVVPASVIWQGGVEPPRTSGNVYEVSIVDNCASFLEFIPYDD